MTVSYDFSHRISAPVSKPPPCLQDRFEVLKDIGDGSFGSVVSARVRTGGSHIARRGTIIAIKTMKRTFDSLAPCLELREVIFLKTLPSHAHLVPALDIFLDPMSKKLHICMEHMDFNLYQLMKARDHRCLDDTSVKSILFQILSGLQHIHAHHFFHRDIKPENIMVSGSISPESGHGVRRSSALATPPATPPVYSVKIADFGLARETQSKLPYTTYVSTRWYRAPEVLLRAGEYSAPVDIWAVGAMAVEVATLKPLFPGSNEVDQVWRVCEIMGSPGSWYNKAGAKVGGGDWREGNKLASKLGFSFPKMAPHSIDTILQAPRWPASLSNLVTSCLMWDPRNRPTSSEALNHPYFVDAVDPLRPRSTAPLASSRTQPDLSRKASRDSAEPQALHSKPSWFRKSFVGRENVSSASLQTDTTPAVRRNSPLPAKAASPIPKARSNIDKRATWANGMPLSKGAPMPILPMLRPISPLSDPVTAQASARAPHDNKRQTMVDDKTAKKIGRQLSVASTGNHYADIHRQEAERALNGNGGLASPLSGHRESFFSHLRKRARRLSGRNQLTLSPSTSDIEANPGCGPWSSNRSSMVLDSPLNANVITHQTHSEFQRVDETLRTYRYGLDPSNRATNVSSDHTRKSQPISPGTLSPSIENASPGASNGGPVSSRTRRAMQMSNHPVHRYETPDEEDELLDEIITSAHKAAKRLDLAPQTEADRQVSTHRELGRTPLPRSSSVMNVPNPYPTPLPSAKRNSVYFGQNASVSHSMPLDIHKIRTVDQSTESKWPTPPDEESGWAAAAAASICAAGAAYN